MSGCGSSAWVLSHIFFTLFILKFHLFSSILVHFRKVRDILVFLSVLFSCCVWCFRRWLSPTLYQTTATFVLGDRPPYVESPHRFPSESRFINLPSPPLPVFHLFCLPCARQETASRPHCSVCVDVCTSVWFPIWECYLCVCVDCLVYSACLFWCCSELRGSWFDDVMEWFVAL